MNKRNLVRLGSETARGGFRNEKDVIDKFNNWEKDTTAQKWLEAMGYSLKDIEYVKASKIRGQYKADVQVRVQITIKLKSQSDIQNLQVKLVSSLKGGFNQIDKRWVDSYAHLWNIPNDIVKILKLFTGEIKSTITGLRKPKRMFLDEMSQNDQDKLISFIQKNKILIISDILKGRGEFSADWTLVVCKSGKESKWVLKSINHVMNVFGAGNVCLSPRKSLNIGKILMQRKGGDNGRPTANMLQFKINPVELFND